MYQTNAIDEYEERLSRNSAIVFSVVVALVVIASLVLRSAGILLFMLPLIGFNGLVLALVLKLHIRTVRRKYEKMEAQRW